MTPSKIYDALIIGSGPAGLSAALGLGRVHRNCAVISSAQYRNAGVHAAHAILTRDNTDPEEIRRIGREEIERYGNADFIEGDIETVRKEAGDGFDFVVQEAADQGGRQWKGRTLILATGCRDVFPDLEGYAENWPANIYQCLFCDGHERSHLPSGVLCYPHFNPMLAKQSTMAHFLSLPPFKDVSSFRSTSSPPRSKVTLFTNGPLSPNTNSSHANALETCAAHGITVDQRKVLRLVADTKQGVHVELLNDTAHSTTAVHLGYIFHKPPTEPTVPNLINQLGLEISSSPFGKYITVIPPFNSTNIPGVFACGDAGAMATHVTVAMSTGIACAAGVAGWCNERDDEIALDAWRNVRMKD